MKKVLIIALLLLQLSMSTPGAQAQTLNIILPDSLAGKNWVKNLVREELKKIGTAPPDPVVVDPAKDPCKAGPNIVAITNVSATYLNVQFHGKDVFELEWKITNPAGTVFRQGEVSPVNSTPGITYNSLEAGTYTLIISGKSCSSKESTQKFIISGSVGIVDPPASGKYVPSSIAKGMDEHLQLKWEKQGDSYLVSDLATPPIGSDYEFRYLIGSEVIKTGKKPISNYKIEGVNPGRIVKYKIKPDLILNNWTSNPGDVGYYYSLDAAEGFSYNTSVAFQTYAFPGNLGDFVNPIPASYNPSLQNTQWGDFAKEMQLPKGHVFVADPRPWGIEASLKMGVTHISNFALNWDEGAPYTELIRQRDAGLTYNDVPRIETVLGVTKSGNTGETWPGGVSKDWWPNGIPSYEEGYQMGLRADISHALFIGEFSENISWLPPGAPVFAGFYDALMPRMEERFGKRGIPYYVCHDYLLLGGETLGIGREQAKTILTMRPDQMQKSNYTPGGTLTKTNLIVQTVYLDAPDQNVAQPYELIFRLNHFKQLGYEAGVFLAGVHEWRPNNPYQIDYPEGKLFALGKIPLDPNTHIANGFLAHVFGKVFVEWGGSAKVAKKTIPRDWENALHWFPNGAKTEQGEFPHFKNSGDKDSYYGYSGSVDLSYFSQKLFVDTYGQVENGTDRYLKFRIDGGAWITPTKHDYVDAYYDKRGFVHSRNKNGNTAFFYLNCFTDNSIHKLEVEMPNGFIWTGKVAGNGIHAKLI